MKIIEHLSQEIPFLKEFAIQSYPFIQNKFFLLSLLFEEGNIENNPLHKSIKSNTTDNLLQNELINRLKQYQNRIDEWIEVLSNSSK